MKCYSCRKYDTCQLDWKCSADMYFCSAYEVEQTNEEWLRQANTEQLVQVIHLMTSSCYVCGKDGVDYKRCYFHKKCTGPKEIEEWLKDPHTPFS